MAAIVPCRLFFLLARDAPLAVVFRRGPSKWVQIINWATRTDSFELGQWFHGRIHERVCDLSPDGKLMVYLASDYGERKSEAGYSATWTAISKPPWLTALALWPQGDSWAGGGLFVDDHTLLLNYPDAELHPDHNPGSHLRVLMEPYAVLLDRRMKRDGWVQECEGSRKRLPRRPPEVWSKPDPNQNWHLVRQVTRVPHRRGMTRTHIESFALRRRDHALEVPLPDVEWAEWDQRGRLVYARGGCILTSKINDAGHMGEVVLADFNAHRPVSMPPPKAALVW